MKDWNPSHFLDVAEMATAVATGYDWLYPSLTPAQRQTYSQALIEKALKPAKHIYDSNGWWSRPRNNWAQVCGAGIAIAAAAVAENEPELTRSLFESGRNLIQKCGQFYQPDGMYSEGPTYWHYGSNYHVMFLAAAAALGEASADDPILRLAGDSIMHLTSPTRLSYNFADGTAGLETPSPAQSWLAVRYQDAGQAQHVRSLFQRAWEEGRGKIKHDRYFPLSVLWLPAPAEAVPRSNAAVFLGEQSMALFRSGWAAHDVFFAIKGGTAAASHAHMDVGSFVFDAHGQRWIHDLGAENYNLPAYFGNKRWSYYRLQNRAHSTLEIDGKLQDPSAKPSPVTRSTLAGESYEATLDLSAAYAGSAANVIRHASFDAGTGATKIRDEVTRPSGDVVWRAFTDAKPEIRGDEVILRKKDQEITLRKSPGSGTWSIRDAKPPTTEENQNEGISVVTLTAAKADRVKIEVEINP
ncbi:MAG: heparinase II/III family protein [Akkermansiaceae bacterium]